MSLKVSEVQRKEIAMRWFDRIIARYPPETASFLLSQPDPFANPVGAGLREELEPILFSVLDGEDPIGQESALDRIIRVRALQEMSPSEAVAFIVELKQVFDEVVVDNPVEQQRIFAERVDRLLLVAFDVYSRCREQVYEIRVREIRNRSLKVMERLNEWREQRAGGPSAGS
jgi:hypothetical protein